MRGNDKISRRAVLRGLAGTAVPLPALELMLDGRGEAYAAQGKPIPKRYIVCFAGSSLGADGDPLRDCYVPDKVGRDYDLKVALEPLAPVQDEVSVVSGLRIPYANGGPIPPGGRGEAFHVSTLSPLFSGMRAPPGQDQARSNGVTSDHLVAAVLGKDTTFKTLSYRAQAAWYLNGAASGREHMSWIADAGGQIVPAGETVSPRAAYDALFFNFAPREGTDPAQKAHLEFLIRTRTSVLDMVSAATERLSRRLGAGDRQRLVRHFDEVRDLERRITALPATSAGLCAKPEDPKADPPTHERYSNEDERARIFGELIHMACTCDLTRVATLMYTMFQSHLNAYPLMGARTDVHEVGHNGDPQSKGTVAVSKVVAWHVRHFASLVARFRDTPEGAGRLIDNTVLVLLHEGGHGFDPQSKKNNSAHSSDNMACLIAGRAGGLKPGQHVAAKDKHPANVLVSAMNAVGMPGDTLGEVTGPITELFA